MDIRYRYPKKPYVKNRKAVDFAFAPSQLGYPEARELPPVGAVPFLYPWKKSGEMNKMNNRSTETADNTRIIEAIINELDSLIGLDKVKKLVKEIQAFVEIQGKRAVEQLATEPLVLHMIFKGKPLMTPVKKMIS